MMFYRASSTHRFDTRNYTYTEWHSNYQVVHGWYKKRVKADKKKEFYHTIEQDADLDGEADPEIL